MPMKHGLVKPSIRVHINVGCYIQSTFRMSGMLDRSPIKRRPYPVLIIVVDWDIKYQIKQVSSKFNLNNYFVDIFGGTFFVLDLGIFLGYVTK